MQDASTSSPAPAIRLAVVVRPAAGGILKHVSTLCSHLPAAKFRLTVFAPASVKDSITDISVPFVTTPISARLALTTDLRAVNQLARAVDHRFDIIHAHGQRAGWIAGFAGHKTKVPVILTAHNLLPPLNAVTRIVVRIIGNRATRVIAVSEAVKRSLAAGGISEKKILVIPNGVDLRPFDIPMSHDSALALPNISQNSLVVLAIGRLAPEKGFDILIKAFQDVQARWSEARLIIAGDGPMKETLQRQANLQRPHTVIFTGRVTDTVALYSRADIVVVPSRSEGQGLVALEAMAARKPVVAARVGGLKETIVDGVTGLMFTPESSAECGAAIEILLQNGLKRSIYGLAGRQRVEEHYTLEKMLATLEQTYADLLGQSTSDSQQ